AKGQRMSATEEILAAGQQLVTAFGRHDVDAYFDCFDAEATFVFYSTPEVLGSRAEYRALFETSEREDGFRVLSCESAGQSVQDLGDTGVFTHAVTTTVTSRDGESTLFERETIVFRRQDSRWVAVHEHLSPQPVPASTAEPA